MKRICDGIDPDVLMRGSSCLTPVQKRLQELAEEINGAEVEDKSYLHVIMAQIGLPYSNPGALPFYHRSNGNVQLAITPGVLFNKDREPEMQGIPYGAKARLLVIYFCTEAIKLQRPTISVEDSMSAFIKRLGIAVTGGKKGSVGLFKEQLNRLTASRMQLFNVHPTPQGSRGTMMNPAPMIQSQDVWFPRDPEQRVLWPSSVKLSDEFFRALMESALPLDPRAIKALRSSAMALDVYCWLAHRLWRIKNNQPQEVSWVGLQRQFGPGYGFGNLRSFQQTFREQLARVLKVYRDARVQDIGPYGLELRVSPPPVPKIQI